MKLVFHRENDQIDRLSIARLDSPAIVCPLGPGTLPADGSPAGRFVWNDLPIAPYQRILMARFLELRHIRPF